MPSRRCDPPFSPFASRGSVITPRTRAIVVNTPHNPTGKVFSRQELEAIADVVRENPRVRVRHIKNAVEI